MSDITKADAIEILRKDIKRAKDWLDELRGAEKEILQDKIEAYEMAVASLEIDETLDIMYDEAIENLDNLIRNMMSKYHKKGYWNDIPKYKNIAWQCSECEHFTSLKHNYCPHCGTQMNNSEEIKITI